MPSFTQPVPKVYINGYDMANLAYYDMDIISGLNIKFGTDSTNDMPGTDSCSISLMVRQADDMDFLHIGAVIAVNSSDGQGGEYSHFVGRITTMDAEYSKEKRGAVMFRISAVSMMTDLANLTVYDVNAASNSGSGRLNDIGYYAGGSWGMNVIQQTVRWATQVHAGIKYGDKDFLEMMDAYLRGQLMYRTDSSYYDPELGVVKQLSLHELLNRRVIVHDSLQIEDNGVWRPKANAPKPSAPDSVAGVNRYQVLEGHASLFTEDTVWSMEPDDVINDLKMQRIDTPTADDSTRTPINSRTYFDTAYSVDAFGLRSKEVDTDLPAGAAPNVNEIDIMQGNLTTSSTWRLHKLKFADTEMIGEWITILTATHLRYTVLLSVFGFRDNVPARGYSLQRGMVVGGNMSWLAGSKIDNKPGKWELEVNLSDYQVLNTIVDQSTVGTWGYDTIASLTPTTDATFDSVGYAVTYADFQRIG